MTIVERYEKVFTRAEMTVLFVDQEDLVRTGARSLLRVNPDGVPKSEQRDSALQDGNDAKANQGYPQA